MDSCAKYEKIETTVLSQYTNENIDGEINWENYKINFDIYKNKSYNLKLHIFDSHVAGLSRWNLDIKGKLKLCKMSYYKKSKPGFGCPFETTSPSNICKKSPRCDYNEGIENCKFYLKGDFT